MTEVINFLRRWLWEREGEAIIIRKRDLFLAEEGPGKYKYNIKQLELFITIGLMMMLQLMARVITETMMTVGNYEVGDHENDDD